MLTVGAEARTRAPPAALTGRDPVQYTIAGILLAIGVVLWVVTVFASRASHYERKASDMATMGGPGPIN